MKKPIFLGMVVLVATIYVFGIRVYFFKDTLLQYVKETVLKEQLDFGVDKISVYFFPPHVHLNDVSWQGKGIVGNIEQLSLYPSLTELFFKNKLKISRADASQITLQITGQKPQEEIKLKALLEEIYPLLPDEINGYDINITYNNEKIFIEKSELYKKSSDIEAEIYFGRNKWKNFEIVTGNLLFNTQNLNEIIIKKSQFTGPKLNVQFSGNWIPPQWPQLNFSIDSDIKGGIPNAKGNIKAVGKIKKQDILFHGNWKNVKLDRFDLHQGEGDFRLHKNSLQGKNIQVKTHLQGQLDGELILDYTAKKTNFIGSFKAKDLHLKEILDSLEVPSNIADFKGQSEDIKFQGEAIDDPKNQLFLTVTSKFQGTELRFPDAETDSSYNWGECQGQLNLHSTSHQLDLTGTSAQCPGIQKISVKKGIVEYETGKTYFLLENQGAQLNFLKYFLGKSVTGFTPGIKGILQGSHKQPMNFTSQVFVNQGVYDDLPIFQTQLDFNIDEKRIKFDKINGKISGGSVKLKNFVYEFKPKKYGFDYFFTGQSHEILQWIYPDSPISFLDVTEAQGRYEERMEDKSLILKALLKKGNLSIQCQRNQCEEIDFNLKDIPIKLKNFQSNVSTTGRFKGNFEKLKGEANLEFNSSQIGSKKIERFNIKAQFPQNSDLAQLQGQYLGQVFASAAMPKNFSGLSSLHMEFKDLDLKNYFSISSSLYGYIDGHFLMEKGKFKKIQRLDGLLDKANFYIEGNPFEIKKPVLISSTGSQVKFTEFIVDQNKIHFLSQGQWDFETQKAQIDLKYNIDLEILEKLNSQILSSKGNTKAQLKILGDNNDIQIYGSSEVNLNQFYLKDYQPIITDFRGDIIFKKYDIILSEFSAKKGTGKIEAQGALETTGKIGPNFIKNVFLKTKFNRVQSRIPLGVLKYIDTVFSGEFVLSGNKKPYQLAGRLQIHQGRSEQEASCDELIKFLNEQSSLLNVLEKSWIEPQLEIVSQNNLSIQSKCITANVKVYLKLKNKAINGSLTFTEGKARLLKSQFIIQQGSIVFENTVQKAYFLLTTTISPYTIYLNAQGKIPKIEFQLWSIPPTMPTGDMLTQQDYLSMIASNYPILEPSSRSIGQTIFNVWGFLSGSDSFLDRTVSSVTGGFVESAQAYPILDGGKTKLKTSLTKKLGDRAQIRLDWLEGSDSNDTTLMGDYSLNQNINLQGSFDYSNQDLSGSTKQFFGGLRFHFGSD
jgi:hypothetical protein